MNALADIHPRLTEALSGRTLPDALQRNLERHWHNLCALADTLRGAGLDEASVAASLDTMLDSYRAELATTFEDLLKETHP